MIFKNHHVLILQRSKCCLIESNKNTHPGKIIIYLFQVWAVWADLYHGHCSIYLAPWATSQPDLMRAACLNHCSHSTHSASLFSNKFMQITCTVFLNHSAEEHGTLMIYTTANVTHTFIWFHQKKRHLHRSNQHRCEPSYCLLFQITCSSFE